MKIGWKFTGGLPEETHAQSNELNELVTSRGVIARALFLVILATVAGFADDCSSSRLGSARRGAARQINFNVADRIA